MAEEAVGKWCRDNDIQCSLAGFSAAWRLAPEVRYSVANVYVESRGFEQDMLEKLKSYNGGKGVETGANLLLWRPFDLSVMADSQAEQQAETPITSAIQTYLDLRRLAGRGEEAATAVYERLLVGPLREAAQRIEEIRCNELRSDKREPRSPHRSDERTGRVSPGLATLSVRVRPGPL